MQLYSYEFHVRKPSTEIFRIAADKIGERSENILFVGDRIDNDIRPALESGMRAVLKDAYTNAGKNDPGRAPSRIRRLAELPALIEQSTPPDAPAGLACRHTEPPSAEKPRLTLRALLLTIASHGFSSRVRHRAGCADARATRGAWTSIRKENRDGRQND